MFGIKLNKTGKSAPISSHRAFPAVVALWFAALLGLGSLIVPVILFETLATGSGISSVIPAAAPPLGTTARLAIAAVAAIVGATAGIFIARKVAAAQSPAPTDRSAKFVNNDGAIADHDQKRPISAREELGSDYLDEPIADADQSTNSFGSARRRSLAVTDESGPSEFLETVPLPGGDIVFDTPSDDIHADALHDDPVGHVEDDLVDDSGPLVLGDLDLTEAVTDTDVPNTDGPEAAFLPQTDDMDGGIPVDTSNTESAADVRIFNEPATQVAAEQPAQLSPREELAAMTNRFANPSPITAADDTRTFAQPPEAAQALETDAAMIGNSPVSDRALGELGMVELVERFALALQNQKAQQTAAAAIPEEPISAPYNPFGANIPDAADIQPPVFRRSNPEPVAPEPLTLDTVAAEPTTPAPAPAEPSFAQAAMSGMPAGMTPLGFDDFDEEDDEDSFGDVSDLGLSLKVPSSPFGKPDQHDVAVAQEPIGAEHVEQEEVADDFSSLLAMKSSLGGNQEFVRVDADLDEPTPADPGVVFPGQTANATASTGSKKPSIAFPEREPAPAPRAFDAPPGMQPQSRPANNGETERALKEALEKLQKMSGAA